MGLRDLRDQTAIVGVGTNYYPGSADALALATLVEALENALADAGLSRDDLDGIMINYAPEELAMDNIAEMLGLKNVRYAFQSWQHGRMNASVVGHAALAAFAELANYIACIRIFNATAFRERFHSRESERDSEAVREGGGPHLESPPYGLVTPPGGAAMAMQRYFLKYRYGPPDLAVVAVSQRAWARLNPNAVLRERPLDVDTYLRGPYVIEPLRVPDNAVLANTAQCVIVSGINRARDLRQRPVYISGMQASRSHKDTFVFGRSNLGVSRQDDKPYRPPQDMTVYRMADVSPKDIDILGIVDNVSPPVPFALEEFGFCAEGEALGWMQGGRTAPGGELPINTHGGGLSEGLSGGWGALVELVRQLRGEAGERQVEGAELAQYMMVDRSSLILRR